MQWQTTGSSGESSSRSASLWLLILILLLPLPSLPSHFLLCVVLPSCFYADWLAASHHDCSSYSPILKSLLALLAPQLRCSVRAKLSRLLWCLATVPCSCGAVHPTPFRLFSAVWLWQWRQSQARTGALDRARESAAAATSPSIDDHSTPSTFNFTAVQKRRFSNISSAQKPNSLYPLTGVVETAVQQTLRRRQVASVEIPQRR